MDLKKIKQIIQLLEDHQLKKICLKEGDYEICLEKEGAAASLAPPVQQHVVSEAPPSKAQEGKFIKSPMVGTFYASPAPDQPPFVRVGEKIDKNTVVGIIEAMKVLNEVKADESGIIKEILVENGMPVEFGTKLFRVE